MKKDRRAFTLIELLVVVLIISILVAVALPQYQKAVIKSEAVWALAVIHQLDQFQQEYYLRNGAYTTQTSQLMAPVQGKVSCGTSGSTGVYCTIGTRKDSIMLEWQGDARSVWICLAGENNSLANEICQKYQFDWGGTKITTANGYNYYWGAYK